MTTQPIVYCQKCGEMIPFDDFINKKATTLAGLHYCAHCNPLASEQTNTTNKPVSISPPKTIRFKCPQCSKTLQTKLNFAGKNIKCPGCTKIITVPSPAPTQSQPKPKLQTQLSKPSVSRIKKTISKTRLKPLTRRVAKKAPIKTRKKSETNEDKKSIPKFYLIGGAAAGLVLIVGLIIFFSVKSKQNANQERLKLAQESYDEIIDYQEKHSLEFKKILALIDEYRNVVKQTKFEYDLGEKEKEIQNKANVLKKADKADQAFAANPTDYDGAVEKYTSLKNDARELEEPKALVAELNRRINDIETKREKEIVEKIPVLEFKIDAELDKKEFQAALALCDNAPEDIFPSYLKKAPKAQDELTRLKKKIQEAETTHIQKQKDWQVLYNESTSIASGEWHWEWRGCTHQTKDNNLIIINNTNKVGAVYVGETEWKDYEIEATYKVIQGALTILTRADYKTKNSQAVPVRLPRKFDDDWNTVSINLSGTRLNISGVEIEKPSRTVPPKASKKGTVGFMLPPGVQLILKELKVKLK